VRPGRKAYKIANYAIVMPSFRKAFFIVKILKIRGGALDVKRKTFN
jgi:hypothetical protein